MSWMDSWSRPSKSQPTPAPFYLLPGGESTPYCKSCGRVIGSRKSQAINTTSTPTKYCSSRCRNRKPGRLDREIEGAFVKFLIGEEQLPEIGDGGVRKKEKGQKKVKGDSRILVNCDAVEKFVFERQDDPEKMFGRKKNRAPRGKRDQSEWKSVDMVSDDETHPGDTDVGNADIVAERLDGDVLARLSIRSGTRTRPPQEISEVNGSVGGEKGLAERIEETEEMAEKRREGDRRAQEREMVRCAARRGVAFGFVVSGEGKGLDGDRRNCEAVMQGKVVDPSFAKGDWSVRWRE